MPLYPSRELEIIRLAQDVSTGLVANRDQFPAPPATPEEIDKALAAYNAARETAKAGAAEAAKGLALKEEALNSLSELVKADIQYAESMTRKDGSKLQSLGWGPAGTARSTMRVRAKWPPSRSWRRGRTRSSSAGSNPSTAAR